MRGACRLGGRTARYPRTLTHRSAWRGPRASVVVHEPSRQSRSGCRESAVEERVRHLV